MGNCGPARSGIRCGKETFLSAIFFSKENFFITAKNRMKIHIFQTSHHMNFLDISHMTIEKSSDSHDTIRKLTFDRIDRSFLIRGSLNWQSRRLSYTREKNHTWSRTWERSRQFGSSAKDPWSIRRSMMNTLRNEWLINRRRTYTSIHNKRRALYWADYPHKLYYNCAWEILQISISFGELLVTYSPKPRGRVVQ